MISVILPTHNSEKYIKTTLKSLVAQSFTDFEALLIDSSKDKTVDIAEKYLSGDRRLRVIRDDNGSYGHKINRGIQEAKGKYVTILESDDRYHPDMLNYLHEVAERDNADVVKGWFLQCMTDLWGQEHNYSLPKDLPKSDYNRIIDPDNEPDIRFMMVNNIWTGIYKTQFLRDNRIFAHESPGASYQDTGFSILVACYAHRIEFLPFEGYLYTIDNSGSSVKSAEKYMCIANEFYWVEKEIEKRKLGSSDIVKFVHRAKEASYDWNARRLPKEYRIKFIQAVQDEIEWENREVFEELDRIKEKHRIGLDLAERILRGEKEVVIASLNERTEAILGMDHIFQTNVVQLVCDNDTTLQGSKVHDINVVSPQEATVRYPEASYIITSKKHANEIADQLVLLGINNNQISVIPELPPQWELSYKNESYCE